MPKYSHGRVKPGMSPPTTRRRFDGCLMSSPKSHACGTPPSSSESESGVAPAAAAADPTGTLANPLPYTSASRSLPYSTRIFSVSVSTILQNSSSSALASHASSLQPGFSLLSRSVSSATR